MAIRIEISGEINNCLINSLISLAINQYRQANLNETVPRPDFDFIIQEVLSPKFGEVDWHDFISTCDIREIEYVIATAIRRYLDSHTQDITEYRLIDTTVGTEDPLMYDTFGQELNAEVAPYLINKLKLRNFSTPVLRSPYDIQSLTIDDKNILLSHLTELPSNQFYINHTGGNHFELYFENTEDCLIKPRESTLAHQIKQAYNAQPDVINNSKAAENAGRVYESIKQKKDELASLQAIATLDSSTNVTPKVKSLLADIASSEKESREIVQNMEQAIKHLEYIKAQIMEECTINFIQELQKTKLDSQTLGGAAGPQTKAATNAEAKAAAEAKTKAAAEAKAKAATNAEAKAAAKAKTKAATNAEAKAAEAEEKDESKEKTESEEKSLKADLKQQPKTFWTRLVTWFFNLLSTIKNWGLNLGKAKVKAQKSKGLDNPGVIAQDHTNVTTQANPESKLDP